MTRTKKILIGASIALVLLLLVAVFVANFLLSSYSREAMETLSQRAKRQGVVVSDPQFDRARIAGIRTARWTRLAAQLQFPDSEAFAPDQTFDVFVGQADLSLVGNGEAVLQARDVAINTSTIPAGDSVAPQVESQDERVLVKRFECQFPLDLLHPMPSLEQSLPELIALLRAGATQMPIEAEGTLEFEFDGAPVKADLRVDEVDNGRAIVLDPNDLRDLGSRFEDGLTNAEVKVIASYPLRVVRLLHIKDDAEKTSADAKKADEKVPQDAFRHVLWSYLLTQEYGPRFAQVVTNAHEEGDTGNTLAERDMDLHNNSVGRLWGEQNVPRAEILSRVLAAPDVIREPR